MGISDVYLNRPYAPAQDVLGQQERLAQQAPGIAQNFVQGQAMQEERARNARPVTAWEKALMHMINGGHPKEAAAMVKSEMSNAGGGAMPQMPRPLNNQNQTIALPEAKNGISAIRKGPDLLASGMDVPERQSSEPDITKGMTHRDYNEYVDAAAKIRRMKTEKSQGDLMELELERTRRALGVAQLGKEGKVESATIGGEAKKEAAKTSATQRADAVRESLRFKREHEANLKQYRSEYLDVLRNRQSTYDSYLKSKGTADPVFNALVTDAKAKTAKAASIAASSGVMAGHPDKLKEMKEADEEQKRADERVLEYIESHPNLGHDQSIESGKKKQSGYKKPEVEVGPPKNTVTMKFKNGKTAEVPMRDEAEATKMGGVRVE